MSRSVASGALVALVALVVYVATSCPTIWVGDSGELASVAARFGVAHPPGYPTWTLLARTAVELLPSLEPARATNLLSAVSGAAAVFALALLLAALTGRVVSAAAVALAFGLAHAVWSTSTVTEVYSLNLAFTAAALAAAVVARRGRPLLFLLAAYLLGLGSGNHPFVLLAGPPVLALALLPNARAAESTSLRVARTGGMALAFLLGLTVYVVLPLRAASGPEIHWGELRSFADVVDHVLRTQYGGLGEADANAPLAVRLALALRVVLASAPPLVLILALVGPVIAWRAGHAKRAGLVVLFAFLSGPVVALALRYQNTFRDESVITPFFLPAVLATFLAAGLTVAAIEDLLARRVRGAPGIALRGALLATLPLTLALANRTDCDRRNETFAAEWGQRVLESLPAGARLVAIGDNATFSLLYEHVVRGVRPDVKLVDHSQNLLVSAWGDDFVALDRRERRARRSARELQFVFQDRATPLFYTEEFDLQDFGGCRLVPAGAVLELVRPGDRASEIAWEPRPIPRVDATDYLACLLAALTGVREGTWLASLGRTEEAHDRFVAAAEPAARIPAVLRLLGGRHLELGDVSLAERRFRDALALAPDDRDALYNLALLDLNAGRPEDALRGFERLENVDPPEPEVELAHAVALVEAGRLPDAAARLERVLAAEPDLAAARRARDAVQRGISLGGEAGLAEARAGLGELSVGGTLQLAGKYVERADWERAIELYREALRRAPESPAAAHGLGFACLQAGRYVDAAAGFRRQLELEPGSAEARNGLAYVFAITGDSLGTAERLVTEALELSPEMAAYWNDTLGWVRYRSGDAHGALEALLRADTGLPPEDVPSRAETEYHLGVVLAALGRASEAAEYFRRSLGRTDTGAWVPDLRARARELGIEGDS
ncbi:MAG: DUF2723 domain-containing protein [Gemmatimonadetes bacterium]|nr:DUF2723 domain-containing protein [Gemmatimonadota bacterium]